MAVATNFLINGKEYLIPMVIEEASVVAAASNAAKVENLNYNLTIANDKIYSACQTQWRIYWYVSIHHSIISSHSF